MDRSWISDPITSKSYKEGVEEFLEFASQNALQDGKMKCPCNRCNNLASLKGSLVKKHLLKLGFDRNYTWWVLHGENDLPVFSFQEGFEWTENNNDDVDQGDDWEPAMEPGDSAGNPEHAGDKGQAILVPNGGADQHKRLVLVSGEKSHQGPDDQKISTFTVLTRESPAEGSSGLIEKNDGDIDRGDHPKHTEEPGDSASQAKPAKDKGKAIPRLDEGSNQLKALVLDLNRERHQGLDNQDISTATAVPGNMLDFAFCLYTMRMKFGCEEAVFEYLIGCLVSLFPMFYELPQSFNHVWDQLDKLFLCFSIKGSSRNRERLQEMLNEKGHKCFSCGQELTGDFAGANAGASTSSQRRRRNKGRRLLRKNAPSGRSPILSDVIPIPTHPDSCLRE